MVKCAQGCLINVDRGLIVYLVRNAKTMVLDINMFLWLNLVSIHSERGEKQDYLRVGKKIN